MSVYNGEKYLREAIDSILDQSFKDFEFLIINDGSIDKTHEILKSYDGTCLRIIEQENMGLTKSLNKGLSLAKGQYIARMDADDISLPHRLEKQVRLMDREPDIGICGTWVKTIGDSKEDIWRYPTEPEVIRCRMLFESALAHPSVMIRRSFFINNHLSYDEKLQWAQDYELWVRCSSLSTLKNLEEVLLLYRSHPNGVGKRSSCEQRAAANLVRKQQLSQIGLRPDSAEFNIHERLSYYDFEICKEFVEAANLWLMKLLDANGKVGYYHNSDFEQVLAKRWYRVCTMSSGLGLWVWKTFCQSSLSKSAGLNFVQRAKLMAKCGMKYGAI